MRIAVLVLSANGLNRARRLKADLAGDVQIFGPSCIVGRCGGSGASAATAAPDLPPGSFATDEPGLFGWTGPLRLFMAGVWWQFDAIVAMFALGIAVRVVGPLLGDKRHDPAVIVVDEAARFAIGVLGGHQASGNALTLQVARSLGATAVITTASEALGVPAVDLIGRDLGWTIERPGYLKRVAAVVVRGDPVAVWQDAGSPDWWRPFGPWPEHFTRLDALDDWRSLGAEALLVISDRRLPAGLPEDRTIVYRPRTLVAGMGCKRGTSEATITAWFQTVFAAQGLAEASLAAVATVTLKADEAGLIGFAQARNVRLLAYPPEELAEQPGIATPSERVREKIGISSVAEASALKAAGADRLLVVKQVGPGVTLAVARRADENALENCSDPARDHQA